MSESTRCGLFYGIMPNDQETFCDRPLGHDGACRLPLAVAHLERENDALNQEIEQADRELARVVAETDTLRDENATLRVSLERQVETVLNWQAETGALREALRKIRELVVLSDGSTDSYDGTANPVIKTIIEEVVE